MKADDLGWAIAAGILGGVLLGYFVRLAFEQRKYLGPPRAFEKEVDEMLAVLRAHQEALVQVAWTEMRLGALLRNKPPGKEWDNTILRCVEVGQRFSYTARLELEERGLVVKGAMTTAPEEVPKEPLASGRMRLELVEEADPFADVRDEERKSRWDRRTNRRH